MIKDTLSTMHMHTEYLNTESVIRRMIHTTGLDRFIYSIYFVIGVVFYGIGFLTGYGVLLRIINPSISTTSTIWLFIAYTVINCIIGYGFIYHRRWLIVAFTGSTAFMLFKGVYLFFVENIDKMMSLYLSIILLFSVSIFLYMTRKVLVGSYFEKVSLIVFFSALLFSFLLLWQTVK